MKKQISICIFLSVIVVALSLAFIKRNNTKKEYEQTEHTQMMEDTQDTQEWIIETNTAPKKQDYMFCILEKDNRLVVYETKTETFYMETGILAQDLPDEIRENLKNGIFFRTESDLYDFLESYSS